LPFRKRADRRERQFKRAIVGLTALAVAGLLFGTGTGRYAVATLTGRARLAALRLIGLEPDRAELEAMKQVRRERTLGLVRRSLADYYRGADPEVRRLFQVAGVDPAHGLIVSGRSTDGFLLSPEVFAPDPNGRSYRMLPGVRAVWLRQITVRGGPLVHFLVRDTPAVRSAAAAVGAVVEESSAQSTNSWGLRGPEPDPAATARVLVLGDSFMHGMFVGDADAPPLRLQHALAELWGRDVSVLNTGHIGYAPEQYYASLKEYGDRFRPHFVVISVCPNDFGNSEEIVSGQGPDWDEARYWLGEIVLWCRGRAVPYLLVPVPEDTQVLAVRKSGRYQGRVCDLFPGSPGLYCDPLDRFIDEHLRLRREAARRGAPPPPSPLYNHEIGDGHFSPLGAELWARVVARRIDLLLGEPPGSRPTAPKHPPDSRVSGPSPPAVSQPHSRLEPGPARGAGRAGVTADDGSPRR
jgi:hypothetical protein